MSRTIKVLRKDIQDSLGPICSMSAVCIGIYMLLWILFTFIFGSGCSVDERKDYFWIMAALFSALTPGTVYGYVNSGKGRSIYLLLPASAAEKFIVMVSLSVVIYPGAYILIQGITDSLLTAIGGYYGSIWPELVKSGRRYLILIILSSTFLLGNLQFKSRRIGKSTILTFSAFLIYGLFKRHVSDTLSVSDIEQVLILITSPILWLVAYKKLTCIAGYDKCFNGRADIYPQWWPTDRKS